MTNEEAIKKLEHYRYCLKFQYGWYGKDDDETLDMAVQSLTTISELSKRLKAVNRYDMDEKVLIGFNMAVAIFNECFGEVGEKDGGVRMTEYIILSRIDMLTLCDDKPITIYIDKKPYVLCTDEYFTILNKKEGEEEQSEQNVGMCQQNVGEMSEKQTDGDLISRKDLLKELNKWDWQDAYLPIHFAELVADLPSAEKTAKWINETEETIECGNCHHIFDDFGLLNGDQEKFYEYPNFCPNCGRKMIGVEMKGVEK